LASRVRFPKRPSPPRRQHLRRGAARATKLLQCQPTLGARAPYLGPSIVAFSLAVLANDPRRTPRPAGSVLFSPEPPMRATRSPRGAAASSPPALARTRTGAPSNRPRGQLARASGATLPRRSAHASGDARFFSPVRATPTPSSPTRDPRRRATSVICEPIQASATPKGGLSPGAFPCRRVSSRSLPHRPRPLTDESMSGTSNAF